MFRRDELGLPGFWPLQVAGWTGFYLLILITCIPYLKRDEILRTNAVFVSLMFCASCLLRPVCQSLLSRQLSWIALEGRAFAWSLLGGTIAGSAMELLFELHNPNWSDLAINSLQAGVMLFLWCSLYFSIKQWQQSARERDRLLRAEAEVREAHLSALRYQLNPHFLFNSLNAVSTLVLEGNAQAANRMLAQIGQLLRATLDGENRPETALSDEIAFTEQYLAIEQTRLGDRLRLDLNFAPETLDASVPSMLLQPLVENAVRHGITPLLEGGALRIQSKLLGDRLQLILQNPAPPDVARKNQAGIGLTNTSERLQTLYGRDHKLQLEWTPSGECRVTVELPLRMRAPVSEALSCAL